MTNPKLALIPSGYKSGKVYSILPNDASGDFDFTRQSIGTRVRKDGLIEEVADNVPRLDWLNSNCPSLKLEPQRTNLVLFSEQFSGTNWGTVNTTITANQTISPDGQLTADKLQRTSTSASYRSHNISKSATAITYTTSVFIKKGSDDYFAMRAQGSYPSRVDIRFRFDTQQIYSATAVSNFTLIDYGVENYQNGWYRLHFTYTSDTHTNLSITFSPRATDGAIDSSDNSSTSFAYVWGAQTEVANYVSSYIKTEGSTVTRLADVCSVTPPSGIIGQTEGVVYVEVDWKGNDEESIFGVLHDGTVNNRMDFGYSATFNSFYFNIRTSGSSQGLLQYPNPNIGKYKIAIAYKNNDFSLWINGVNEASDSSGSVPVTTKYNVGNYIGGGREYPIISSKLYNTALTDAELTELTT